MAQYQLPKITDTIKIILITHGVSFIIFTFAPDSVLLFFILSLQKNMLANISLIYRVFTYILVTPFNILGLLFFALFMWWVGSMLEESWGKKTFIAFYLITTSVSGILCLLIFHFTGISTFVAGITGITFSIIAVFAFLSPNSPFYIFGIFPLKAKWLLVISIVLTFQNLTPIAILYSLILQIVTGLVAVIFVIINFPLPAWASPYLGKVKNRIENIKFDLREGNREHKFTLYKAPDKEDSWNHPEKASEEDYKEARKEIDKLLDKIRKEGINSLTDKEKKFLDDNSGDYQSPDNE